MDWTLLAVAAMSAGAGLGGVWIGGTVNARAQRDAIMAEHSIATWRERRNAYAELYGVATRMGSRGKAVILLGSPFSDDQMPTDEFIGTATFAKVMAPEEIWADMDPLVKAVSLLTNYLSARGRGSDEVARLALSQLEAMDILTGDGWDQIEQRFLAAARRDLESTRP